MRFSGLHVVILVVACLATLAATQPSPDARADLLQTKADQLDRLFSAAAQSGGSYIVSYQLAGRTFSRAYGRIDCARAAQMRNDALFDGGSLTKLFTAAAVYKLVEQGRLKLDDRLGELFPLVPGDRKSITVAQLLDHRSGIPNFIGPGGRVIPEEEWGVDSYDYAPLTKTEMLARAWAATLDFPPGTNDTYSNSGFTLLAAIVERASGQPYEAYVRQNILLPAGMRRTGYLLPDRKAETIAQQCRDGKVWGDPLTRNVWRRGVSWHLMGAGGMLTTTDDLQRWNAATASGSLFRPDIYRRWRATYFAPSYRNCGTDITAVGGSNGMTRSLIIHLPLRRESVVAVSTQREYRHPSEEAMIAILCPK